MLFLSVFDQKIFSFGIIGRQSFRKTKMLVRTGLKNLFLDVRLDNKGKKLPKGGAADESAL